MKPASAMNSVPATSRPLAARGHRPGLVVALISLTLLCISAVAQESLEQSPQATGTAPAQSAPAQAAPTQPVQAVPASRQADNVAVITIRTEDGPINRDTAKSFVRRLELVERGGADAFVVEIDTPGGEINAVLDICHAIKSSSIKNSVAWINTRAISGGAIIALACREIVVHDAATMGDALPIAVGPTGIMELPPEERAKMLVGLLAEVVHSARQKNEYEGRYVYDESLVQSIMTTGVELWWIRNKTTGEEMAVSEVEYRSLFGKAPPRSSPRVASVTPGQSADARTLESYPDPDLGPTTPGATQGNQGFVPASPKLENLASDVNTELAGQDQIYSTRRPIIETLDPGNWELVEYLTDGTVPVTLSASDLRALNLAANPPSQNINDLQDLQAWFAAKNIERLDPLWSESLASFMTSLPVRFVLIVVFVLALFVEMLTAGTGLAGGIAAIALGALLVPPFLTGMANWWEIGAIIAGIVLILTEVFVIPGFGVAGLSGLIALFLGLLGTFIPDQGSGLFPGSTEGRRDMLYGLLTILLAIGTSGVGMYFLSKHFGTIPILKRMILDVPPPGEDGESMLAAMATTTSTLELAVGAVGTTRTVCRPVGEAEFDGRVVDVSAETGFLAAAVDVRVVEVDGMRVVVAEIPRETPDLQASDLLDETPLAGETPDATSDEGSPPDTPDAERPDPERPSDG